MHTKAAWYCCWPSCPIMRSKLRRSWYKESKTCRQDHHPADSSSVKITSQTEDRTPRNPIGMSRRRVPVGGRHRCTVRQTECYADGMCPPLHISAGGGGRAGSLGERCPSYLLSATRSLWLPHRFGELTMYHV